MSVKRNIVANALGSGWSAIMNIAFIPLYIKYLGVEAYGLIGVFAILLGWLTLLDMGLTPTISREMARFSGQAHTSQSILDLLRSVEVIAIGLAVFISGSVYFLSDWLATSWIDSDIMGKSVVVDAIIIMGIVAALRFLEGIYRSAIVGLQRQVELNIILVISSTLRGFGAVLILAYYSSTVEAFFLWQGVVSMVTIVAFGLYLYRILPKTDILNRFSWCELDKIKKYAAGMIGTTFLAILLTQVDKILLVKLLSLSEYGYYIVAFSVASALSLIVSPISQAFFPKFAELKAKNDSASLVSMYHKSAQIVTVFIGTFAGYLIFFSDTIVLAWTNDSVLSSEVAPLVSLISLGTFLNILMWMPYQMQLAYGWTSLTVKINAVAVLLIVPAILIVVPIYGAIGAAWVWVVLNAGYVFIGVHFMYRKILINEKWKWYFGDVFKPLIVCFGLIWLFKIFLYSENVYMMLFAMMLSMGVVFISTLLVAPLLRDQVVEIIKMRLK